MTLTCPLCGSIVWRIENVLVWAFAVGMLLCLTLEALMIAALIRLASA